MHALDRCRGFTLLELLVALTLFAILMTAMLGGLRLGARVWDVSSTHLEDSDGVLTIRRFLRQRLEDATPATGISEQTSDQPVFIGEPRNLRLASSMPASLGEGLFLLHLALSPQAETSEVNNLVLRWRSWPARSAEDVRERTILHDVVGIRFAYYATGDKEAVGRWHDSWRDQHALPDLIRVDIQFPPGDGRGMAPAHCVADDR